MNPCRPLLIGLTLGSTLLAVAPAALAWPSCGHQRMAAGPANDEPALPGREPGQTTGSRELRSSMLRAPGGGTASSEKPGLGGSLILPQERRWRM